MENEKLVIEAVNILANKLGTTGTHLWGVLVRQAPISAITSMSLFIVGFLLAILGWIAVGKIMTMLGKPDIDNEIAGSIVAIISSISFLISIILLFNIGSIDIWISGLCNPEYWAFQNLIHTFK